MTTKSKLIVALVVVIAIIGTLITTAITHASTYYLTVPELYQKGSQAINAEATVSGTIVGKSIKWDPAGNTLSFHVEDLSGGKVLPVIYHGSRPDDFSNNWPVIVTGKLGEDRVFTAEKLLIKCPSKYQAANQTNGTATTS